MLKWIARALAGLFTVFCAIIVSGNALSSAKYWPNTDGVTPSGGWAIYPESVERAALFLILGLVSGLFAIRGRLFRRPVQG
jgi:hypothetical protein